MHVTVNGQDIPVQDSPKHVKQLNILGIQLWPAFGVITPIEGEKLRKELQSLERLKEKPLAEGTKVTLPKSTTHFCLSEAVYSPDVEGEMHITSKAQVKAQTRKPETQKVPMAHQTTSASTEKAPATEKPASRPPAQVKPLVAKEGKAAQGKGKTKKESTKQPTTEQAKPKEAASKPPIQMQGQVESKELPPSMYCQS